MAIEMIDGIDEVVEFLPGRIALAEFREGHAASGAAAIVRIEHGHAARRCDLAGQVVTAQPSVTHVRLRSAMHGENQRVTFPGLFVERANEDAFQIQPVACFMANHFLPREAKFLQSRIALGSPLGRGVGWAPHEQLGWVRWSAGDQSRSLAVRGK